MILPQYVSNNYFCDVGPKLWTEKVCTGELGCCGFRNPPWFSASLSEEVSKDILVSICCDEGVSIEDVLIQELVIFIQ